MKKLMIAAAAMAAAFAVNADTDPGLVSSTVVGYMNVPNDVSGYCQRGATFIACGSATDSYDIQSIIPQVPAGAVDGLEDGSAVIQEIDDFGVPVAEYHYFLEGSYSTGGGAAGWYYFDDATGKNVYANKTFTRGVGFLYQAPYFEDGDEEELGSSFLTSGEVKEEAKSVLSDVSGYCHRSNYRTTPLSIQKLTPVASEDAATELEDGAAVIQEIDDYGVPISEYHYFLEGSYSTSGGAAGWYYFDDATGKNVLATKVFAPGEGFLYQAPYFEDEGEDEVGSYLVFGE